MHRFERLLDTVFGYTGWHDITNTGMSREQEMGNLYNEEDEDDPTV
ncbi:hypothetical protein [Ferdinandcohnia sp. Marseille-Q9671]